LAATSQRRPPGWHALGAFWAIVVAVAGCGCLVLQLLGPPLPRVVPVAAPVPVAQAPKPAPVAAPTPPGQIAAPQPALLEQSSLYPPAMLPRIGPNGQVSRIVYARPFKAEQRPTIAIVITGLGMSEAESRAAIETLPGPVSLAFSPYAPNPDSLLDLSRKAGHEMLISLPLEPQGYPLNDAGSKSLLTGASPSQNAANLEWSLSRIQGYVGAMRTVLDDLSQRGLLYVDPRPGKSIDNLAQVPGRSIDVVIDDPQSRADIEGKLAALERLARERGSALGFAGPLRPVTVERIATWARGLADKGMVLAPVSALINPLVQPEGVAR